MDPSQEPKDLDAPAFTNRLETVISYKGDNFYKSCGEFVSELPNGGRSHCVKRIGHAGSVHEDFDGRTHDCLFVRAKQPIY